MKLIKLSEKGKHRGKYSAIVDDADFEWLNKYNWCVEINSGCYAKRFHKNEKGVSTTIKMHRQIMDLHDGDGIMCDHINRNGLDCRRHNLRRATRSQNMMNRLGWGRSKYKGVKFCKRDGKWVASINMPNGKQKQIGSFKTEENAATAYNIFAEKYHGEFAVLNIN